MVGAALSWLAKCDDVPRINIALQPLADAVSSGRRMQEEDAAALAALQPVLETLPPGSANAALLAVHRLLQGSSEAGADGEAASSSGGSMHAAVSALVQLPEGMRDSCLQLVTAAVPALPPGTLSEADVQWLLQWLLVGVDSSAGFGSNAAAPIFVCRWVAQPRLLFYFFPAGCRGAAAGGHQAASDGSEHPGGAPGARAQPGSEPHAERKRGSGATCMIVQLLFLHVGNCKAHGGVENKRHEEATSAAPRFAPPAQRGGMGGALHALACLFQFCIGSKTTLIGATAAMASSSEEHPDTPCLGVPDLPHEVLGSIAAKLEVADRQAPWVPPGAVAPPPVATHLRTPLLPSPACRIRLAATCQALRASSVDWFRNDIFEVKTNGFRGNPPAAEHLEWLGKVHGELALNSGRWRWRDAYE